MKHLLLSCVLLLLHRHMTIACLACSPSSSIPYGNYLRNEHWDSLHSERARSFFCRRCHLPCHLMGCNGEAFVSLVCCKEPAPLAVHRCWKQASSVSPLEGRL